jgi:peptidoglycan/xylan/chitin deacetylase (PgdA/CDA1 family)
MKKVAILATVLGTVFLCQCANDGGKKKKRVAVDSTHRPHKDSLARHENKKPAPKKIPDSSYKVYITIDDGPDNGSRAINRIAREDSAKMTVLLVGWQVYKKDSLTRLFKEFRSNSFIEVGSHSYSHAGLHYKRYYKKPAGVIQDFQLNADTLQLTNRIIRLPGRNTWRVNGRSRSDLPDDTLEADSLAAAGYTIFGWDIEWRHVPETGRQLQTADNIMRQIEEKFRTNKTFTSRHVVILVHDSSFADPFNQQQLELLVKKLLRKKNYRLEFLSNYP